MFSSYLREATYVFFKELVLFFDILALLLELLCMAVIR